MRLYANPYCGERFPSARFARITCTELAGHAGPHTNLGADDFVWWDESASDDPISAVVSR